MGALALLAIAVLAWLAIQVTQASRNNAEDRAEWESTSGSGHVLGGGSQERSRRPNAIEAAPGIPPLPELAVSFRHGAAGAVVPVTMLSGFSIETHSCDLAALTCTCESFSVFRAGVPFDSLMRLCKHLRAALGEAGLVSIAEKDAEALWYERGGRLFKWNSSDGKVVYFSVDPTRDWINVDPVRVRRTSNSHTFGWSISEQRWAYGKSPRGLARQMLPALAQLVGIRAEMRGQMPADVEQQWDRNRDSYRARLQQQADDLEAKQRAVGLLCRICETPFGRPWGTELGTPLRCSTCGFTSLVTKEREADVDELAAIDWKYYDDPRPGGVRGPISLAREEQAKALDTLRARADAGLISADAFSAERSRIENEWGTKISGLYGQRAAELEEPLRRVRNATARFKRHAKRETRRRVESESQVSS